MKNLIIHEIESELKVTQESIMKAYPSIYSKEDVMKLLDGFVKNITLWVSEAKEEKSSGLELTFEQRQDLEGNLREAIEKKLDRMSDDDVVDFDSAEFNIEYGNTLRLDSININASSIAEELDYVISDVISDFFSPVEVEEPQVKEETPSI